MSNSPLEDDSDKSETLTALAGAPDEFLAAVIQATRDGTPLPPTPQSAMIKSRFWFSLDQERRPPHQGCWFLKEMMPLKQTEWQRLASQGEEFEGEDTG